MGFWKKVNKTLGLGENNDLARIGAGIMTGGLSEVATMGEGGGLSNLLLGKKAKDIKPDDIANQIRATQTKGINELNAALDNKNSEQIVKEQVTREKAGVLTAAQDARRNAQRMMAQRGLQNSSLGLNQERSITQDTTKALGTIDARIPGAVRDQQLKDAHTRIGVGNINQNGINFHTIEGQRSGGLLGIASALAPVAGTVAGAYFGGPAGAAMGSQVGSGIGGALGQQQQPQGAYNPNRYSMGNYQF